MGTLGIYKRVSTEEQSLTGISLSNQESKGIELAKKLGYDYIVYGDEGVSGKLSIDKRPGLKKLFEDIAENKINAIFVLDLDRLSRGDILQVTIIKNFIKENNIELYDVNGEINLKDINQEFLADIRSLLNAYETKKTSERIKQVLTSIVKEGKVSGGPLIAYGYKKGEGKQMIIDEVEAEIVKLIYSLSLQGKGTRVIANYLNEQNIPTKRSVSEKGYLKVRGVRQNSFTWKDTVVYRILTNKLYIGEREHRGEIYKCPAILDKSTFELTQRHLKQRNSYKDTRNKYTYLLKGLIYCSRCKGRFYGHKRESGKDNAYICISKRNGPSCGNIGINIDYLDDLVLRNVLSLEKQIDIFFNDIKNNRFTKSRLLEIEKLKAEIIELNTSSTNLLDTVEKAGMDPVMFRTRFESIQKKKTAREEKQYLIEKNMGILSKETEIKDFVKSSIREYKKYKTDTDRIMFLRNFVDRIYIQYDEDEMAHYVAINYKLTYLSEYQLTKEILVNRTRTDSKRKRIETILNEDIVINNNTIDIERDKKITRIKFV
jgi:DNA invertase Pin-like site-specific DNA recombinase